MFRCFTKRAADDGCACESIFHQNICANGNKIVGVWVSVIPRVVPFNSSLEAGFHDNRQKCKSVFS